MISQATQCLRRMQLSKASGQVWPQKALALHIFNCSLMTAPSQTLEMHNCLCTPELPAALLRLQQATDESKGKDDLFSISKKGTQFETGNSTINMTRG